MVHKMETVELMNIRVDGIRVRVILDESETWPFIVQRSNGGRSKWTRINAFTVRHEAFACAIRVTQEWSIDSTYY